MFHLKEYLERPKKLAHLIPWALLIAPGVVLNKTGSFQSTFKFYPPDLESSTEEELSAVAASFNNAIKRLGSGWAYFVEAQRKEFQEYPESNWPNEASELIDSERKDFFLCQGNYFVTEYYFTFSYIPPKEEVKKFTSFFEDNDINYHTYLQYFHDEMKKIVDIMETIFPTIKMLNDDETLTYLHSCISTKWHKVHTPNTPLFLDYILSDEIIECGLNPKIGDHFLKVISIKGFPQESYPQIFQELDKLSCSYRWSNRFICIDNLDASNELKKYAKYWFSKSKSIWSIVKETIMNESNGTSDNHDSIRKSEECNSAADLINSGEISVGYYTSCFVLFDKDPEVLRKKVSLVEQIINAKGFVTINETYNCISAWLGSLPGHCWANVRRPLMPSLNLSHLLPLSTNWSGQKENRHLNGPPLFFAKSNVNTPFMFSNHVDDVGHTMVLGPTGSGKSFLLSFIAAQFQRYKNSKIYFFDKDYSAYCITAAMGGLHYDLGETESIYLQPLENIHIESERLWAREWIIEILNQESVNITPKIKKELWEALVILSKTGEKNQRTLTGLVALLQEEKDIKDAIDQYTLKGSFKSLDGSYNSIDTSHFQCFEVGRLISDYKTSVIPVLSYLFHKIEQQFTGNPSLIILDEAWLLFDQPIFAAKIKDWLKTLRKKNVSVIFATQSIADIMESSIIHTLIESCPTRIFLPNRKAFEEQVFEIYKKFGLNERQIDIISSSIPKRQYYCYSDIGCGQFELEAGPKTKILCGSSSLKDRELINKILKKKTENFTYEFLNKKGGL